MTNAVVTTRTRHRASASVRWIGSSGDGLATVSNRAQREGTHRDYRALDREGRARGRLAAFVLIGLTATATACRTDALPTPRPLPAPVVAAEEVLWHPRLSPTVFGRYAGVEPRLMLPVPSALSTVLEAPSGAGNNSRTTTAERTRRL